MNAARLSKSDRLQRVLRLLKDRKWYSTRAIIRKAHVCAVNSIASELRSNGYRIDCRRERDVWSYRLRGRG